MAGIYIHVPFCKSRCFYCDFFKSTKLQFRNQFLGQLLNELKERRDFFNSANDIIETVYFGGGTPSLIAIEKLEEIVNTIAKNYSLSDLSEITIEVNPDDLNPEYLSDLRRIGFNRISLGIQSFFDEDLKKMGRRHDALQSRKVIDQTFDAGFENVGIDLIYGLPWSKENKFSQNLKILNDYPLKHLSAYHLTMLHDEAEKMGFDHYEISNYCRDELYSRHNTSYWTGKSYLGAGPGAHSFDGTRRYWNKSDLNDYIKSGYKSGLSNEILTQKDRFNERLMLGLRTRKGVNTLELSDEYSNFITSFETNIQKWIQQGFLKYQDGMLYGTRKGWFVIDGIIEDLFEV
jgi:oxygen-independent coproporphyrinogen-3 oxidase